MCVGIGVCVSRLCVVRRYKFVRCGVCLACRLCVDIGVSSLLCV